jgi:hypothetical protein
MVADLQDLSSVSKQLNAKSDSVNETIAIINKKLTKLNIGLEVWLEQELRLGHWASKGGSALPRERTHTYLGYHDIADGWQLAVKFETERQFWNKEHNELDSEVADVYYQPLLKAARELRIAALPQVPDLLDSVKQRAEEVLRDIEAAEKAAEEL